MVQDSSDNLDRGCRLQDRGGVQGRIESRQRVVAYRRDRSEARLARGRIREHDAFLGYEIRAQQGLGVVASRWLGGGEAKTQGRVMG